MIFQSQKFIWYFHKNSTSLLYVSQPSYFAVVQPYINSRSRTEVFCGKRCSLKLPKNVRKTPAPESLLRPLTLFKKRLGQRCFPANLAKVLRTLFLQNTSEQLLLSFYGFKILHVSKIDYIKKKTICLSLCCKLA